MPCCQPYVQGFVNVSVITVPYSAQMLSDFGTRPKVQVLLQDSVTGEFVYTQFFIHKELVGFPVTTSVVVDLGGPGTGIVRIQ